MALAKFSSRCCLSTSALLLMGPCVTIVVCVHCSCLCPRHSRWLFSRLWLDSALLFLIVSPLFLIDCVAVLGYLSYCSWLYVLLLLAFYAAAVIVR